MQLSDLPWKGKRSSVVGPDETLLWHTSRHFIRFVPPMLIGLLMSFVVGGIFWESVLLSEAQPTAARALCLVGIAVLVFVYHWFFHWILSETLCDIILTKKRVVYITHSIWLSDLMHDIALNQVKAVEAHQTGIIQHLFDYGEIWFDTGGSSAGEPNQTIAYVPKPQKWATEISRAIKAV